jgi:phosphoribosylglycinamide formyltransferase-1
VTSGGLRIGVLGSGNGSNCQAILDQLPGSVAIVLSDVENAGLLERARKQNIPAQFVGPSRFKTKLEPELEARLAALLQAAGVDLVVLAGYLRVVKTPLLKAFAGRMINVHPSLLPAFPGLRAWEQALNYGVRVTGCTVHFVNEGIDAGPVILQQPVPVFPGDTPERLHQRIQIAEHTLLPEAIRLFAAGRLQMNGRTVRIL